jgi:DNA polymerase I-like protein with 3'-5' exonuclease and polymerase domains
MGRRSSIGLLDPEVRAGLDKRLAEGRMTLDGLLAELEENGVEVSRSALGRYRKTFEETAAKLRESREVATAFAKELGTVPDDEMGRMLIELVHTLAFRMMSGDQAESFKTGDLMKLAIALKSLSSAKTDSANTAMRIRKAERERVAAEMSGKLAEASDLGQLSAEAAREARRILGFGDE